jgi:HJR/Mrr/RecB family endonuclease
MYHCNKAQVITNSKYTPMAWSLARANNVWVYDRNGLISLLLMERKMKEKMQKTVSF